MTQRVSVVVPTCKRPGLLNRCLVELLNQDLPGDQYEIIIADDAAERPTAQVVKDLAARFPIQKNFPMLRYVPVTRTHGPAAARNAGWRAAEAPIIAFTDDDTLPERQWLSSGLAAMSTGVAALWGRIKIPCPPEPTDYERDASRLAEAGFVTANCFCRREALETIGGFDERFRLAWREDSDLFFSLMKRQGVVAHAPQAVVVHPIRPGRWGISLFQQKKSLFDALLFKKHPDLFRSQLGAQTPWNYYAIVGALWAALISFIFRRPLTAWAALALWAVLTFSFFIRRLNGTSHALAHVLEMAVTSVLIPPVAIYWRLRGAWEYRVLFL